jgi:hypothetical protein
MRLFRLCARTYVLNVDTGRREIGLIAEDPHTHVVAARFTGPAALCGAGRITQRIPGMFDPTDRTACPRCANLLTDSA